jgi:lipopolysaccharide transport system permease protein
MFGFLSKSINSTGKLAQTVPLEVFLHRIVHLRDLVRELVMRDMKLRYKRSFLGIIWSLLNPLLQLLVFSFVFGLLLPLNIPHYASFLLTGVLAWSWFASSLLSSTGAIVDNRELIKRPGFPAAVLPTVTVTSHLVHFLLALPVLFICLLLDVGRITGAAAALPVIIVLQFVLTLSLAYLVATFHVTFRDTQYLLGVLLQLLFFLTPVFYTLAIIPEQYRHLLSFNPMVPLIEAYRSILILGQLPESASLFTLAVSSTALLIISYLVFMQASCHFAEEL